MTGAIEVTTDDMIAAAGRVEPTVRRAIRVAARHIRRVARRQIPKRWTTSPVRGVSIEQRVVPLDRVGCYVPAGRFPLPSSLLMTAIPARVAGVPEIIAVCPRPDDDGTVPPRSRPVSRASSGSAARTQLPRSPTGRRRSHASTRSWGLAARTWPRQKHRCRRIARLTSSPARPRSQSSRRPGGRHGSRPTYLPRRSTIPMPARS